jgi:hypothetical protein
MRHCVRAHRAPGPAIPTSISPPSRQAKEVFVEWLARIDAEDAIEARHQQRGEGQVQIARGILEKLCSRARWAFSAGSAESGHSITVHSANRAQDCLHQVMAILIVTTI